MWTCRHGGPRGYRGILWWRAYYKQHPSRRSCSRVSWVDAEIEDGPWESASEVPRWCRCCHGATLGEPAAWTVPWSDPGSLILDRFPLLRQVCQTACTSHIQVYLHIHTSASAPLLHLLPFRIFWLKSSLKSDTQTPPRSPSGPPSAVPDI